MEDYIVEDDELYSALLTSLKIEHEENQEKEAISRERNRIIEEQDAEYQKSLEADKLKQLLKENEKKVVLTKEKVVLTKEKVENEKKVVLTKEKVENEKKVVLTKEKVETKEERRKRIAQAAEKRKSE